MKKILILIAIIIFTAGSAYYYQYSYKNKKIADGGDLSCVSQKEETTVKGDSLSGIFNSGEKVKILHGFYECNDIKRDDAVIYDYKRSANDIIKIVKAVPGDSVKIELDKDGNGYNLIVNNEILKISDGRPYSLPEDRQKMLSLQLKDYNGIMPAGKYIVLGNQPQGSLDSTRFGFVSAKFMLGKAVKF